MRLTRHNGRAGKNGTYNPKHNDRRFDIHNSEHIDVDRAKHNIYWDCYRGFTSPIINALEKENDYSFEQVELSYYFEHYSDERNAYLQSFNQYKLLIIDDLGIERESQYTLETVYTVIDERYKSGFPFIITTNIELSALRNPKDIEHARIYDRILEKCMPVVFSGKNYRKERGQENGRRATQILERERDE